MTRPVHSFGSESLRLTRRVLMGQACVNPPHIYGEPGGVRTETGRRRDSVTVGSRVGSRVTGSGLCQGSVVVRSGPCSALGPRRCPIVPGVPVVGSTDRREHKPSGSTTVRSRVGGLVTGVSPGVFGSDTRPDSLRFRTGNSTTTGPAPLGVCGANRGVTSR